MKANLCPPEKYISCNDISNKSLRSYTNSPSKIVREDSHCGLLENSCDDLSDEETDELDQSANKAPDSKIEYFDGTSTFMACHKRKNIFSNDIKRVVEIDNESGAYRNWRVSSSLYSEGDKELEVGSKRIDDDDGCRSSADMSTALVGCLPCTPSPSKAAFAVGGAVGGAAKKCAGGLISCKKSSISSSVSPKKTIQSNLDSPPDTSLYGLSSQTDLMCCGVVTPNMKRKTKKF